MHPLTRGWERRSERRDGALDRARPASSPTDTISLSWRGSTSTSRFLQNRPEPSGGQSQPLGGRRIGHAENMLTGRDKLLGQQVAHAVGAFDRPQPCRERLGPRQQLVDLRPRGSDLLAGQLVLGRADRHRRMRRLVRSTPMINCMRSPVCRMVEPRRALLLGLGASPLSSHATAKPRPSRSSFESQTPQGAGRHFVSYLDQDLSNATNRSQRPPTFSSRHFR